MNYKDLKNLHLFIRQQIKKMHNNLQHYSTVSSFCGSFLFCRKDRRPPRSFAPSNHLPTATSVSYIVELEVAGFCRAAPAKKIIL